VSGILYSLLKSGRDLEVERGVEDLSEKRTELVNRLHLQLSDVYTSVHET
jgi:hypothetical protein